MAALLLAKALVTAAADLHLLPAAVACVVLVGTALCWWERRIHSRSVLSEHQQAVLKLLRPIRSAGAAATSSASRSPLRHFTVLCICMGAVVLAEPLVAAAEQYLHPVAIACAVITFAALVNSAVLSLNFGVAAVGSSNPAHSALAALAALTRLKSPNSPTPPDAKLKESHPAATPPPPPVAEAEAQQPRAAAIAAPALRPHQSRLARAAFVVLAALMSTSWFLDLVAAAATELRLPWPAVVSTFFVFSVCFYTSVHMFRSFFRARVPAAAAPPWEGIAAIAAVGVGVAACLVAAGGSAYEYAPARI